MPDIVVSFLTTASARPEHANVLPHRDFENMTILLLLNFE